MSKCFKLMTPEAGTSKEPPEEDVKTDWTACVLCQKTTKEKLQCPADSKRMDVGVGYKSLSVALAEFQELQSTPIKITLARLDEGQGIEATLSNNRAKWHSSCRLKFSTSKLLRVKKRKLSTDESLPQAERQYTRASDPHVEVTEKNICFFCEESSSPETLHNASTFNIDTRVRKCALLLQDQRLLSKLSAGDMVAQDAKYHRRCLITLYNKERAAIEIEQGIDHDNVSHGIALAELLTYIDESRMQEGVAPVFKLADLTLLYTTRLKQLGVDVSTRSHSTRLKNRILANFQDVSAHKQGRNVLLSFDKDLGLALRKACEDDHDEEAIILAKAAVIIRRDMFQMKTAFSGSFDVDCQKNAVPKSLLALVSMILDGPNIKTQTDQTSLPQATLTIAQLIQFNSYVKRRSESKGTHHNRDRETPLPIYVGLSTHLKTRKRDLVDSLFSLGLSISYDRVLGISADLANSVCQHFRYNDAVFPVNLRGRLFTTAAVDNIDHNPSATSSTDSFHGTGISMFQHPDNDNDGADLRALVFNTETTDTKFLLPEDYTNITPIVLRKEKLFVPKIDGPVTSNCLLIPEAEKCEKEWLEKVRRVLEEESFEGDSYISWSAYHADQHPGQLVVPALTGMLPLFAEHSNSVPMIRHSMKVIKAAVDHVNPGQVPVVTVDQPLFAIAKQIQWHWPEYGEDRFVIVLGGLHIELASLKLIGDWLKDSGWVDALVQAKVASSGTADSFLKASHITRTRHAHQVTASSLHILLTRAYTKYCESVPEGVTRLQFEEWTKQRSNSSPQFNFWNKALYLELLVLSFVRSLRESNFSLYVDCLTKLAPWFFALDHTNYARWIPVHLRDMVNLQESHPHTFAQFTKGNFTVRKTHRAFSAIALDQAHEQQNAAVKGDGGAVGLTQNPEALRRWITAGPEMARIIKEFEQSVQYSNQKEGPERRHHDQTKSEQLTFSRQVSSLVEVIENLGNPFTEESGDVIRLDNRDIADPAIIITLNTIETKGAAQFQEFVTERLADQSKPLSETIHKNKFVLFSRQASRSSSKSTEQLKSLKSDCSLFSRLFIACQSRQENLDEFFKHENQSAPPSLSQQGNLRLGTKSDLLECLERCAQSVHDPPTCEAIILDGAAIVHFLKPIGVKTFLDYFQKIYLPYVMSQLQHSSRVDVVWDEYIDNSLKGQTRSKRGKGIRRRVEETTLIPGNWQEFLRLDDNKRELFAFLAKYTASISIEEKQVVTSYGKGVLCNPPMDSSTLGPCNHEEADTRMILHAADIVNRGFNKLLIRTVDTDVVVLAIASVQDLRLSELWVAFGSGKMFRYISAHEIASKLGPDKSKALPFFHAYTGCDTVSSFGGRGKKTAWETWRSFDDVTSAFLTLSCMPSEVNETCMALLERYTVLLYDRGSNLETVDDARKELFTKKSRSIENIPPTKAALLQHAKRAAYQGGHCWGQALQTSPVLPSPADWGWTISGSGEWLPLWTTLPEATKSSRSLVRCACHVDCYGVCSCVSAEYKCSALCYCGGECESNGKSQTVVNLEHN